MAKKIEKRIGEIEKTIPRLEEELAKITLQMSQPEIVSNHEQLQNVSRKFEETETMIQKLYKEWEELAEF
ncbi:MAG: ABC transporter C-terminal domain-containing protein [Acidobacteriota bacterium]|nr:ABC transporter C-terminal domain-containing protein [Acidobacteriota bacterium]